MSQSVVTFPVVHSPGYGPASQPSVPQKFDVEVSKVKDVVKLIKLMDYIQKYERSKKITIVTQVLVISTLVLAVALTILFPPFSIPFLVGASVSGVTLLAITATSVVYFFKNEESHLDKKSIQ